MVSLLNAVSIGMFRSCDFFYSSFSNTDKRMKPSGVKYYLLMKAKVVNKIIFYP